MPVHLTKEFLNDLRESRDGRFIRQVLNHTIGEDGAFTPNRDDHRYQGIKDAWIRYVSRGNTAYRVIFIRRGADIYLYRAGVHSIEDNLVAPASVSDAVPISSALAEGNPTETNAMEMACLLKTSEATFVRKHIEAMFHVRHKEIYIVSPFIDLEILESRHRFGRFLDRAIEENTVVVLITSYEQGEERLSAFKNLEERGVNTFFLAGLHSKLYVFDIDLASRNSWQKGVHSHAIVGSSNLTNVGLGFSDAKCNEELNCRLPSDLFEETKVYVNRLIRMSDDYTKYAFKSRSRKTQ
jgi:hypothetical protein